MAVAPGEGKSFSALVAVLQEQHAKRLATHQYLPFFPAFPKRKTEIKVVTSGLIYAAEADAEVTVEAQEAGEAQLGLLATSNYELSAAAGARCAEQNALGLLIHHGVSPSAVRYIVDIAHSIFAERRDHPVPLALGPCPICCDHLRGLIKGTPSLGDAKVYIGTPGLEGWMPSLGEQVGTVKRGSLLDRPKACGTKRGADATAAADSPPGKRSAGAISGGSCS